jgi:hypothetical protein
MTEAELARDLHAGLEKVRQGTEVAVEQDRQPIAILRASEPPSLRSVGPYAERLHRYHGRRLRPRHPSRHRQPPRAPGTAGVGLILDSSVVIAAERQGQNGVPDARGDWLAGVDTRMDSRSHKELSQNLSYVAFVMRIGFTSG